MSDPTTQQQDIALRLIPADYRSRFSASIAEAKTLANAVVVSNAAECTAAKNILVEIATRRKRIVEWFKPKKQAMDLAKQTLLDGEREFLNPLDTARQHIESAILTWEQEENRKAAVEAANRQQEAEAAAQKERDYLNAQAAKAKLAGDTVSAQQFKQAAQQAEAIIPAAVTTPTIPQVRGVGSRTVTVPVEDSIKLDVLIVAAARDRRLRRFLVADISELKRYGRDNPGTAKVPGVVFRQEVSLNVRAK
jgi:hypothetical protein